MALRATTTAGEPDLLFLPWAVPLEAWPADLTVALPRGISRHTVGFVEVNERIYAVKETTEAAARREYDLLAELRRLGAPCVEPVGIVAGRQDADGEELAAALVTRHLPYSLPYRALVTPTLRLQTGERLLDALVVLLVRLHLFGFAWNDCSLSNALFLRDAGEFAAYLVDAETGELRPGLSDGQRRSDVETAALNVCGELLDLQAGGMIPEAFDVAVVGDELRMRYEHLWMTLTEPVSVTGDDRHQIHTLLRTLNGLGFDVGELSAEASPDGTSVHVRPQVVEPGHHRRRMMRLTGLEMHENQARRLLNDLDSYRAIHGGGADEQVVAHRWVHDTYEAVLARVPAELRRRIEDPELVHEVLQHRWFGSERAGRDVGLAWATDDYVDQYLRHAADEAILLVAEAATDALDAKPDEQA
ncbi:MAG: DUF4032 domain-containing protein [Candidatus Nanopelagicales bacterium]|nr:DUF4032 domain-containing protein [Candidatus Nanopelagicales bacterium]